MERETPSDLLRIRRALAAVERAAVDLEWAPTRPWRTTTHTGLTGGVPAVDLHDLDARLAREAVGAVAREAAALEAGAVVFVTGVGRHSVGRGVLGQVVRDALARQVAQHPGWEHRPGAAGRWILVTDPRKAPPVARARLGWGVGLGVAVTLALLTLAEPAVGGGLAVAVVLAWILVRSLDRGR